MTQAVGAITGRVMAMPVKRRIRFGRDIKLDSHILRLKCYFYIQVS